MNPAVPSATETAPRRKKRRKMSTEPPYKVILHNDDHNSMDYVVLTLVKVVPKLDLKRATAVMLEAHFKKRAVVTRCHKELAELYRDSLKSAGLTSTIEPD